MATYSADRICFQDVNIFSLVSEYRRADTDVQRQTALSHIISMSVNTNHPVCVRQSAARFLNEHFNATVVCN